VIYDSVRITLGAAREFAAENANVARQYGPPYGYCLLYYRRENQEPWTTQGKIRCGRAPISSARLKGH